MLLAVVIGVIIWTTLIACANDIPNSASTSEIVDEIEENEPLEIPVFLELGSFAVALKDGKHNLKVGLQLLLSNEPAKFYLNSRMPLLKDLLNDTLTNFDAEQLKSEEGRDNMRKEVIGKMMLLFPKEIPGEDPRPIRKLLFDEFVLTPLF